MGVWGIFFGLGANSDGEGFDPVGLGDVRGLHSEAYRIQKLRLNSQKKIKKGLPKNIAGAKGSFIRSNLAEFASNAACGFRAGPCGASVDWGFSVAAGAVGNA